MNCKEGHDFTIAKSGYYKQSGEIGSLGLPTYDQSIAFSMLYCKRCGETKEIIQSDHRKLGNP